MCVEFIDPIIPILFRHTTEGVSPIIGVDMVDVESVLLRRVVCLIGLVASQSEEAFGPRAFFVFEVEERALVNDAEARLDFPSVVVLFQCVVHFVRGVE